MKGFTILLLGIIIVTLISEYTEYEDADHLIPGPGIFTDEGQVELITSTDSEYQIYLQVVIRDKDGSLVNVIESTATGAFIPHEITNHVFYDLMGVKEVIVLDNTEYEKAQYTFKPTLEQRWVGLYPIYSSAEFEFVVDPAASITMNNEDKDYAQMKMHYCANFSSFGHPGHQCLPIFQVLVPTVTLNPDDKITQQWTILREIQ